MIRTEDFLATHPVFSFDELWGTLGKRINKYAVTRRLKYAQSKQRILHLCKGIYAAVPYGLSPAKYYPDQLLVMTALREDAIFCGHTALELSGVAYSTSNRCTAYTQQRSLDLEIQGVNYYTVSHRSAILSSGMVDVGTKEIYRGKKALRVLSPERILVEGLQDPRLYGGYSEFLESVLAFPYLNYELILRIAEIFDNSRSYALLGWFLELHQEKFLIPDSVLEHLEGKLKRRKHLMNPKWEGGVYYKRWKLWVPEHYLQAGKVY